MDVLVTGCAGFIGWKVSEVLLAEGHRVVGLDNLNAAYDVRLKEWRLGQLTGRRGFTFARADVADRDALDEAVRRVSFDAVINLAARAGVRQSVEDPWVYVQTNVLGTLNLLELCRARGVRKFVLASSSSLYGAGPVRPFREDAATDGPLSPYAASKKGAEVLCYTYHSLHGLDVSVLRYFTVYGPGGRPDMSPFRFVQWICEGRPVVLYGDGTQERDFTYVDDVARGTVAALRPLRWEVINLGSDAPVSMRAFIQLVERFAGARARIEVHPGQKADVFATWADIGKAHRLLDWRPRTRLDEGVKALVEWYGEQRSWAREIDTGVAAGGATLSPA